MSFDNGRRKKFYPSLLIEDKGEPTYQLFRLGDFCMLSPLAQFIDLSSYDVWVEFITEQLH